MNCTGCEKGIKMCHTRPCLGTPEDFDNIIDAGFADKLRIDYWKGRKFTVTKEMIESETSEERKNMLQTLYNIQEEVPNPFTEDVEWLSGGTEGDVDFKSNFLPTGTCKFLVNNSCELHDFGLKPEQGAESCCKDEFNQAKENIHYAYLWNTPEGRAVVEKFKKAVNII